MSEYFISADGLSYRLPNGEILFENVGFSLSCGEKAALIGENGAGKTTLLKIIGGELKALSGTVCLSGKISVLPQVYESNGESVADLLGISETLQALERIENGETTAELFERAEGHWDLAERVGDLASSFGISDFSLFRKLESLSGGEKEKVLLMRQFLSTSPILIFDEPTNNLDENGRMLFYNKMEHSSKAMLIVSHDRELLERVGIIFELRQDGLRRFGGNYSFYCDALKKERAAMENKRTALQNEAGRLSETCGKITSQFYSRARSGKKSAANKKYSKIQANAMSSSAQSSVARKVQLISEKLDKAERQIHDLGIKLKEEKIKIPLPDKPFLKDKLFELKNVVFSYGEKTVFNGFSLTMSGGERIRICGANGCGKTTLIKLISGQLKPIGGTAELFGRVVYLDQSLSLLNREKTLLDNVIDLNAGIKINDAYAVLANFGFKNESALKTVGMLSGGELLRGSLAAVLGTPKQPDLLIFDEPTNNLDIKSAQVLEEALNRYQGGLIVVSHDKAFLDALRLDREVCPLTSP